MAATVKTSLSLPKTLLHDADLLAQHLNISRSHLFAMAIESFIQNAQNQTLLDDMHKTSQDQPDAKENSESSSPDVKTGTQIAEGPLVINQGDIYWLQLDDVSGAEPSIPHPHIVIQDNVFNHSRLNTVVVCALTSNLKRAALPGNVLLEAGEGNLPRQSVVEASKVSTVDKTQLGDYIGSISAQRVNQILAGMRFLHLSFFSRSSPDDK